MTPRSQSRDFQQRNRESYTSFAVNHRCRTRGKRAAPGHAVKKGVHLRGIGLHPFINPPLKQGEETSARKCALADRSNGSSFTPADSSRSSIERARESSTQNLYVIDLAGPHHRRVENSRMSRIWVNTSRTGRRRFGLALCRFKMPEQSSKKSSTSLGRGQSCLDNAHRKLTGLRQRGRAHAPVRRCHRNLSPAAEKPARRPAGCVCAGCGDPFSAPSWRLWLFWLSQSCVPGQMQCFCSVSSRAEIPAWSMRTLVAKLAL